MKKDSWFFENNFYYTTNKKRILKIIDQYEVYKKIINIKGQIVECGVFKGASLIRFLFFRDLLERPEKRRVIAFDVFGKFPRPKKKNNLKNDISFAKIHDKKIGIGTSHSKLSKLLQKKKFTNYKLIKGNVINTIPKFLLNNKNIKISLLHLDLDIYEPTIFALKTLFSKVTKGGIILIDDYKHIQGATLAVNEFLKKTNLQIRKVSPNGRPYYIKKK